MPSYHPTIVLELISTGIHPEFSYKQFLIIVSGWGNGAKSGWEAFNYHKSLKGFIEFLRSS